MRPKQGAPWICAAVMAIMLTAPGMAAAQAAFNRIVAFGTSLSDPGNAYVLTGLANTPPYGALDALLVPDRPYARGGHHFSNGATWIEQFALPLGFAGDTRPAFRSASPYAANYAVGGARARDEGPYVNLPAQVGSFLRDAGGSAPPDALYVIEIGANDVRDAFSAYAAGGDGGVIIHDALASLGGTIQTLYAAGARTFLVWNSPNIALTPAVRIVDSQHPGAGLLAEQVTLSYNTNLEALLQLLGGGLPGIELKRLDVFGLLSRLVADPAAYGLSTVDASCVTPDQPPFACHRPDLFLFWDGLHPTAAAHAVIARETAVLLGR